MNRPPAAQQEETTKKGEGLARLAAIADVVARRRTPAAVPGPHPSADNPSTRKRSHESQNEKSKENSEHLTKKIREEEQEGDADANGKVIQFRQVRLRLSSV